MFPIFLTMFVASCSIFGDQPPPIVPVNLPPLDPRTEQPCYDPGVNGNYGEALTDNRVALADCRKKHADAVAAYNKGRQGLAKPR